MGLADAGFTTAVAFLEHASTADVLTYTVPTRYPIDDNDGEDYDLGREPTLSQPDHALYSSTWFPPSSSSSSFVLARVIEDGFTLELRWVSFTKNGRDASTSFSELDRHEGTLAPVRFTFPSRIVPNPSFNLVQEDEDDEEMFQVVTVTERGCLYCLSFPLDSLFYQIDQRREQEWSREFKVEQLSNRTPVLVEGDGDGATVVIACSDGHNLVADISQDGLIETELRSPSSFSIRSLVPSFSRRGGGGDLSSPRSKTFGFGLDSPLSMSSQKSDPTTRLVSASSNASSSSPSQLVSLAVSSPHHRHDEEEEDETSRTTFGFGVSRDRKLKVWNLDDGTCLRSIDLPKPSSSSSSTVARIDAVSSVHAAQGSPAPSQQQQQQSQLLLPPTPQPFVKMTRCRRRSQQQGQQGGGYSSYLTLYSPATSRSPRSAFFIYGLATDSDDNHLSQLAPVAERPLPDDDVGGSRGRLVDFQVKRASLEGRDRWTLWTLYDGGGTGHGVELRTCGLSELDDDDVDVDGQEECDDEWTTVTSGQSATTGEWTAAYFDREIESVPTTMIDDDQGGREDVVSTITNVFLRHVSTPGRYPPASFDYAIDVYRDLVESEQTTTTRLRDDELDSSGGVARAVDLVASHVRLERSVETGAALVDEYAKRVKLEWLRFVALLNESRASALVPNSLAINDDDNRGVAFVIARDSVSVPVIEEPVQALDRRLKSKSESPTTTSRLFSTYPETNFCSLVDLVRSTSSRLSLKERLRFELAVVERVRTPFTTDVEDVALDLFERTLESSSLSLDEVVNGLKSFVEPAKTIEAFCQLVVSFPSSAKEGGGGRLTDLGNAVVSDVVKSMIDARYALLTGLALVLVAAWGATADDEDDVDPVMASFEQTTMVAFATLHSVATLEWSLSTEVACPTRDAVDAVVVARRDAAPFEERFDQLEVNHDDVLPVPTYSLVNALVQIPPYSPTIASSSSSFARVVSDAARQFFGSVGTLRSGSSIDSTARDVDLFDSLERLGLAREVKRVLSRGWYPTSPGLAYVEARCDLSLGDSDHAVRQFERAAAGLYFSSSDDESPLPSSLSQSRIDRLSRYYLHVVSLFVPTSFDRATARFAQLALDSIDQEGGGEVDDAVLKDLWTRLFTSWAKAGEYEQAYRVVMSTPFNDTKTTCLAHLISLVCENGATSLLTTLSFSGLEPDLERTLAFRARNSDPLSTPDYYKVLYAYHVSRGDYRSAGTVMYQQARRIGQVAMSSSSVSFRDVATAQCQSYLAATNALSLVSNDNAWVAVVVDDHGNVSNKRRKVEYYIPDDEYDAATSSRPVEMRHLSEIRQEYTIALSRLQLSQEFPELERTNFNLDGEAVVALLSQTNQFDQAFQVGRTLDVDLSSVFETVAEKCVALSRGGDPVDSTSWFGSSSQGTTTWSGSVADKAWRWLELELERHDDKSGRQYRYRYRLVVLERVVALSPPTAVVPKFLTEFLVRHEPRALLQTLLRFDRLEEAFDLSLETIKGDVSKLSTSFSTWVAYGVFDQLLAISGGDAGIERRQQELRRALDERQLALEQVETTLRRTR